MLVTSKTIIDTFAFSFKVLQQNHIVNYKCYVFQVEYTDVLVFSSKSLLHPLHLVHRLHVDIFIFQMVMVGRKEEP